jgi:F-type H+-transporting ATPase subunit epsilon
VIVLAEISERAEEIDVARAAAALARTKSETPKAGSTEADWDVANAAIERATARLQAATKAGSGSGAAGAASRSVQHTAA